MWDPFFGFDVLHRGVAVQMYSVQKNHIIKQGPTVQQRHYFANKGPSSQGYGFSSGHVWM